jgi:hypothetical protein
MVSAALVRLTMLAIRCPKCNAVLEIPNISMEGLPHGFFCGCGQYFISSLVVRSLQGKFIPLTWKDEKV